MTAPFVAVPSWAQPADGSSAAQSSHRSAAGGHAQRDAAPERGGLAGRGSHAELTGEATPSSVAPTLELDLLGALAPFADGPGVTDLFVNGERGLWVDRGRGAVHEPAWTADEAAVRALAIGLVARGGRHLDEASPAVDVRLGTGIRVHAVLPPVSTGGTLLSVRIPRAAGQSLAALADRGMLDAEQLHRLLRAVAERENLLITGAGGTGKTTLLAALLGEAPPHERLVVIEDVAEVAIRHAHVVALEARQPNLEGAGRIGLDALVREALRMRPDRLVVGECRGPELRELLSALNTGHDGGAGTMHANSLADVPARLEALGASAGLSAEAVARQAVSAFDLILHLERRGGARTLVAIGRLALAHDRLVVEEVR
ncbi:TadA family conjugal transfer-associated ATPase [Agromyces mediolanus]|uniref:TadA family conjugal transfer-associated ATPase n=1 Tax=Agromyces mediolanus TaxID=41986 RepID=UPI003835CF76